MWYSLLANLIVAIHVGYVAFVVVGQLLILVGVLLGWQWVRNRWFRMLHLAAIVVVALETIIDLRCPLSDWEDHFRRLAGEPVEGGDFIANFLHNLIFVELPYNHWAFTAGYLGFAVLVLVTFLLAPPRWKKSVLKQPVGAQ